MVRGRNRWVLRLGVVLLAGAAMLIWALRQQAESVLTIVNQSGQTIVEMKVTAADQTVPYRDIPAGKEVTVPFVTNSKERVMIRVKLENGSLDGYMGPAGDYLKFNVLPDGAIQPYTARDR